MTAAEAAKRLGITERRVRQLLADGQLEGRRVGRLWFVTDEIVAVLAARRAPAGRPLGPRRAWGLLDLLDGGPAPWLASPARTQLRASMRKYIDADANRWRSALAGRSR